MRAQHRRDVMGWKSPVGVPTRIRHECMITTSRRQGQAREGLSGGSRRANVRGEGQKLHRRPGLRVSWHLMAKPNGMAARTNAALVRGNISCCYRQPIAPSMGALPKILCPWLARCTGAEMLQCRPNPRVIAFSACGSIVNRRQHACFPIVRVRRRRPSHRELANRSKSGQEGDGSDG